MKKPKQSSNTLESTTTFLSALDAASTSGYLAARQSHGLVAERANNAFDQLMGTRTALVGASNQLNGPDRLVNGIPVQTKYCQTGSKSIEDCFHDGKFRYFNNDGSMHQIEVPHNQYENAVKSMERRISRGEVPGVSDPSQASKLIRRGHFSYEQVQNIAKAGTIESLVFDMSESVITSSYAFGISTLVTFAINVWNGDDEIKALQKSFAVGIKIFGVSLMSQVIVKQLMRTGIRSSIENSTRCILSEINVGSITEISANIAKSTVAALATIAVLSTIEASKYIRSQISGAQFFKNVTILSVGVAAGIASGAVSSFLGGKIGGSVCGFVGASLFNIPGKIIGQYIGAFIGGMIGAALASSVAKTILDQFIEDDAVKMLRIIEAATEEVQNLYVLSKEEVSAVIDQLKIEKDISDLLVLMFYIQKTKQTAFSFVYLILENITQSIIVKRRARITLPSDESLLFVQTQMIRGA